MNALIQVTLSLLAVLAMVAAAAWLVKRLHVGQRAGQNPIRIVAGASVGQRERVVLLEVANTWLLVGVAQGQVRALHHMPRVEQSDVPTPSVATAAAPPFAALLQRLANRGSHG
jgi:flagellar protein FliO/FliZ